MITDTEFQEWMSNARPGDWLTYHVGPHLFGINGQKKTVAALVHAEAVRGTLFICQRRSPEGDFEYRALRLSETMQRRMKSWTNP